MEIGQMNGVHKVFEIILYGMEIVIYGNSIDFKIDIYLENRVVEVTNITICEERVEKKHGILIVHCMRIV